VELLGGERNGLHVGGLEEAEEDVEALLAPGLLVVAVLRERLLASLLLLVEVPREEPAAGPRLAEEPAEPLVGAVGDGHLRDVEEVLQRVVDGVAEVHRRGGLGVLRADVLVARVEELPRALLIRLELRREELHGGILAGLGASRRNDTVLADELHRSPRTPRPLRSPRSVRRRVRALHGAEDPPAEDACDREDRGEREVDRVVEAGGGVAADGGALGFRPRAVGGDRLLAVRSAEGVGRGAGEERQREDRQTAAETHRARAYPAGCEGHK
jgi:hypothetical protein